MRVYVKPSINALTLSHAWNRSGVLDKFKTKGHFALFLLESLARGPLPGFEYQGRKHPLQKNRAWYGDFETVLRAYYLQHRSIFKKQINVSELKELKNFSTKIQQLSKSIGSYKIPFTKIVLSPNPFGVKGEGYGPLIGDTAYAVFTPNQKKDQTWLLVHEVCHSLLSPSFKSAEIKRLIKKTEKKKAAWSTKKFRKYYPRWDWIVEEYFIHAIEQSVTGSSVKEKMAWGLNRLPWFIQAWQNFLKNNQRTKSLTVHDWIKETLNNLR